MAKEQTTFLPCEVSQVDFARLLDRACKVLAEHAIVDRFASILLTCDEDGLHVCASNGGHAVLGLLKLQGEIPDLCVDGKRLLARIEALPPGPIVLAVEREKKSDPEAREVLVIKSRGSRQRYTLPVLPAADYPRPKRSPDARPGAKITIVAKELLLMLERTMWCMNKNFEAPLTYGASLEVSENTHSEGPCLVLATSLNGHAIAMARSELDLDDNDVTTEELKRHLPPLTVMLLRQIAQDVGTLEKVVIEFASDRMAVSSSTDWHFEALPIGQPFAPWEKICPTHSIEAAEGERSIVSFEQPRLLRAIKNAAIAQDHKDQVIHLNFDAGERELRVASGSTAGGDAYDDVPFSAVSPDAPAEILDPDLARRPIEVCSLYLSGAAGSFAGTEKVLLELWEPAGYEKLRGSPPAAEGDAPPPKRCALVVRHPDADGFVLIAPMVRA